MNLLPQNMFDAYALSLPRGHDFGDDAPVAAWITDDQNTLGILRRHQHTNAFGVLVMRRRVDAVWTTVLDRLRLPDEESAKVLLAQTVIDGQPAEAIPPSTPRRPPLWDTQQRLPVDLFKFLAQPSNRVASWMINQLYLALPHPDANWAADFQTTNFHARMWELHLLAALREQGLGVTQPFPSPDFRIDTPDGKSAWIEAVTANAVEPYDHLGAPAVTAPVDPRERVLGPAAVRFAKTIRSKLQKRYDLLPHVQGQAFVLAVADFHASGSMMWSREALIAYLYGTFAHAVEIDGQRVATSTDVDTLLGHEQIPAGLFKDARCEHLSAVVFTNTCSVVKFNRVGVSAGAKVEGWRYTRMGQFFDRRPGALEGIAFCLDVASPEYRALWPMGYEPWAADLEVFHNPHARVALGRDLLPHASHWTMDSGGGNVSARFETAVLWSRTLVRPASEPILTLDDVLKAPQEQHQPE